MPLKVADFDYPLDKSLIAQDPLERRDRSRLMVMSRRDAAISHHLFAELPRLLRAGDLLVLNDTRVIPARFHCRRPSGGRIEGLFCREEAAGRWEVLLKGATRCRDGERLALERIEGVELVLTGDLGHGRWTVSVNPPRQAVEVLNRAGMTPLPPYIRGGREHAGDRERYQTVYAAAPGAVAAPTAGLHFTPALLEELSAHGIGQAYLTLHVGLGTFNPVKAEELAAHKMHAEWYDLPAATAEALNSARAKGGRIVAVGTTTLRVLETAAATGDLFAAGKGWTDIFIYHPYCFRAVDALVTNFHLPRSTLLMLVAAFCSPGDENGLPAILRAYAAAAERRYRFFSYGDAMLIE